MNYWASFFIVLIGVSVNAGPWKKHNVKLQELEAKVNTQQSHLKSLMEDKKKKEDKQKVQKLLNEISEKKKEHKKTKKKYKKLQEHVRFEHPGEGGDFQQSYKKPSGSGNGPAPSFKKDKGVLQSLDALKMKMQKKYGTLKKEKSSGEEIPERHPSSIPGYNPNQKSSQKAEPASKEKEKPDRPKLSF